MERTRNGSWGGAEEPCELTVGQIVAAVAMLTSAEVDDVRAEVEAPLRDLIRWGFLTY